MSQENNNQPQKVWWSQPVQMFLRISGWIVFPLIVSLFVGKWLDKKFNTEPWLLIAVSAVAFVISIYGIIANAKKEFKKIEEENKSEKK